MGRRTSAERAVAVLVAAAAWVAACRDFGVAYDDCVRAGRCTDATGAGGSGGGGAAGGSTAGGSGGQGGGSAGGAAGGVVRCPQAQIRGIDGLLQEGQRVSADADVPASCPPATYVWWVMSTDGGMPLARQLSDAGPTFVPMASDVGHPIRFGLTSGSTTLASELFGPVRRRPHPWFVTGFEQGFVSSEIGFGATYVIAQSPPTIGPGHTGEALHFWQPTNMSDAVWPLFLPVPRDVIVLRVWASLGHDEQAGDLIDLLTEDGGSIRFEHTLQGYLEAAQAAMSFVELPLDGGWFRVDLRADTAAGTLDWSLDGAPQISSPIGNARITRLQLGRARPAGWIDVSFDDLALSLDRADYPLGDGQVLRVWLADAGTHVNPASFGAVVPPMLDLVQPGQSLAAVLNDWPGFGTDGGPTWVQQLVADDTAVLSHTLAPATAPYPHQAPNAVRFVMDVWPRDAGTYPMPGLGFSRPDGGGARYRSATSSCHCTLWYSFVENEWNQDPVESAVVELRGDSQLSDPVRVRGIMLEADYSK